MLLADCMPLAPANVLAWRILEASYHSTAAPMLIRFMRKYQMSHSRSRILSRVNCCGPVATAVVDPLLQLTLGGIVCGQEASVRSKWVPRRMEPGSLADPVKNPFGLQINR